MTDFNHARNRCRSSDARVLTSAESLSSACCRAVETAATRSTRSCPAPCRRRRHDRAPAAESAPPQRAVENSPRANASTMHWKAHCPASRASSPSAWSTAISSAATAYPSPQAVRSEADVVSSACARREPLNKPAIFRPLSRSDEMLQVSATFWGDFRALERAFPAYLNCGRNAPVFGINCRRTAYRFASANSVTICAVFFASPLKRVLA